jgi:hypothetical protein
MARTRKHLLAGMLLLTAAGATAPMWTETAAAAVAMGAGANIRDNAATGPIYLVAKEHQPAGSRSHVAPNVKPIRTPGQCFRLCSRLKGTTEDFATHLAIDASGIQRSDASLRPIMPATIKVRHVTRTGSAGSPNSTIPIMTIPAAPIPVHIA